MNVLLVRPPDPLQGSALLSHTRPMNLAYLAAWLRRAGIAVTLLDYEVEPFTAEAFITRLRQLQPTLLALSSVTPTISSAARLCSLAKQFDPALLTVIGGAHANGLPTRTLEEFPAFDCLVYGEGEETLLELCRAVASGESFASIAGLVHRDGGELVRNSPRPLLANLDALPFPARDLFVAANQAGHASRGFSNTLRSAELFTARGCPFGCSFCAIQATFGHCVRFHSLERIAAELEELVQQGCNHLVIADDTFTLDAERAAAISRIIGRSGITSWNCDTRVTSVTPELLRIMRQNGCTKVAFGVESGSQRILDKIGKQIRVEQVQQAVLWAKEAGLRHIEGNFIIGADPSETAEDLELTGRMILDLPWTFVSVAVIVPYPGTPVYQQMLAAGQIDVDARWEDFVIFGKAPHWRTDHFSASELLAQQKRLTREFYLRPSYVVHQLFTIRSLKEADYWFSAGISYLRWYVSGRI